VPWISAHRGGTPVNGQSAAARYEHAIKLGVDYVEFDVRKTKDRISVICHDDCTVSGRRIDEFTYAELTEELGPEALTFDDLLDIAAGKVGLHLDLKEGGYEAEIVGKVKENGALDRLVITSVDEVVRAIKEQFPDIRAGLSLGEELAQAPPWDKLRVRFSEAFPHARIQESKADFVAVHWQLADFNVLRYCERRDVPAWVWPVDEESALRRFLADPRVTTVITNRPELALEIRKERA